MSTKNGAFSVELENKSFTETQSGPKYESQKETGGDVVCG